jgi:predicted DNA-binding transcriptional regulator YafY
MPVNKDAMARYRILDKMLSDPNHDYTTAQILERVCREYPTHKVSLRMIQKDILALEQDFNKEIERGRGGRGTVRYKDQSSPLFYQELTSDEEEILREALRSLGQFEGLDNFTWLELLRKKLEMPQGKKERPVISFFKNDLLQVDGNLLGQLFLAISGKKVIRFGYRRFEKNNEPYQKITVYPYQLRQYNDRWFLLCNPVGNEQYPFDPALIYNYALDRMDGKIEVVEGKPFIETPIDIDSRFEEIIGVTYQKGVAVEDIFFAVKPQSVDYIRTKYIHPSQDEVNFETEKDFKRRYPSLKDCKFFFVSCRPNYELYSRFASYGDALIIVEPKEIRDKVLKTFMNAAENYSQLETV